MGESVESIEVGSLSHIEVTADIISAYLSNNHVRVADVPGLIASVHAALAGLGDATEPSAPEKLTPAQIHKSISHEALISFEDGRPYKTLRRHLTLRGLTPEAYRAKWGLGPDYPMTAAAYSERRSAIATSLGLGQMRRKFERLKPEASEPTAEAAPEKVGRSRKMKTSAEE